MYHVKYFTTFAAYKQKTNKCMKNLSLKTLALGILALFAVTTVSAQEEPAKKKNKFGLANRIGVGVGYGTEGLGFDVAIPLTQYVQVRAGLNIFPNIKFHENIDVEYVGEIPHAGEQTIEDKVRLDAKFGRTYADLKFDVYPFGNRGNFFVTAGLSFGGSDLMSIKGHSGKVEEYGPTIKDYGINIGDYNIPFDENGDIKGGVKVKKVRPYLGLGFGRLIRRVVLVSASSWALSSRANQRYMLAISTTYLRTNRLLTLLTKKQRTTLRRLWTGLKSTQL